MLEVHTIDAGDVKECTLEYCDQIGSSFNELHCDSLQQAFEQAEREFNVSLDDWVAVTEIVQYENKGDDEQMKLWAKVIDELKDRYRERGAAVDASSDDEYEVAVNGSASLEVQPGGDGNGQQSS